MRDTLSEDQTQGGSFHPGSDLGDKNQEFEYMLSWEETLGTMGGKEVLAGRKNYNNWWTVGRLWLID